ncbi:MAG: DUF1492 domain-containing protein [Oscillospiraceae bacterium]
MNAQQNLSIKFLKQAYRLNELIESNLVELQKFKDLSTHITANISKEAVQGGMNSDKIGSIVVRIVELQNTIDDEIDSYVDIEKDIRNAINEVQNRNEQLLLRLKYLEFLSLEKIAGRMGYSTKQVNRIHIEALNHIKIPKDVPKCP